MATKYQIISNISEKQIETDISNYFGWISCSKHFRLFDVDEDVTGADKIFYDIGFTFYMQFKVSHGLQSINTLSSSKRKNRSKLEDVRDFRHNKSLNDNPTLYFGLRRKAKNALDFQHNILKKFANQKCSQAFYVAPLTLDKVEYGNLFFNSVNRLYYPFFYVPFHIIRSGELEERMNQIPFLKEHISIIPHEIVNTHNHYYSYSDSGSDLAWHSGELLDKPLRLSEIFSNKISNLVRNDNMLNLKELEIQLREIIDFDIDFSSEYPLVNLINYGKYIYHNYGIRQILLLTRKEFLRFL